MATVALVCAWPAHAQFSRDPLLNLTLRRQLGMSSVADNAFGAFQSAAEYAQLKKMMADELVSARRQYWALYPDKPGFREAELEFSRQLTRRELYYLQQTITTGREQTQSSAINVLTGGSRGYEIPFAAQNLFFNGWVPAIRAKLGPDRNGLVILDASRAQEFRRAVEASQPAFDEYMIIRDLEEFRFSGRTPPGVEPHYWAFVSGVVDLLDQEAMPLDARLDDPPEYRGWSIDREVRPPYGVAERLYRDAERLFGTQRLKAVYAQVMKAPAPVASPAELGRWHDSNRFAAMMNLLGSGSPRFFLLGSLRGGGRSTIEWGHAETYYAALVKAAGSEEALLSAAEKLRLAPKEDGSERANYPMLRNPGEFGSDSKAVEACLRDMLGVGAKAEKATELARITELRRAYDFSGEYVVTGQYRGRPFLGLVTFSPNADGTFGITTRVENQKWEQSHTIQQVARWNDENEIRLDVDAAGPAYPPMSYLVDFQGRSLRGKWGTWEQDFGRVELTRLSLFRQQADIGGSYQMNGPWQGTVTVSRNTDDTFLFDFDERRGAVEVKYQGVGRWSGPTIVVEMKGKPRRPQKQYVVSGLKLGSVLVENSVPEQLVRRLGRTSSESQPAPQPGRRRSN